MVGKGVLTNCLLHKKGRLNIELAPKSWTLNKSLFRRSVQAGFCMRQDSAFSISNYTFRGCSTAYSHLSSASVLLPKVCLPDKSIPFSI